MISWTSNFLKSLIYVQSTECSDFPGITMFTGFFFWFVYFKKKCHTTELCNYFFLNSVVCALIKLSGPLPNHNAMIWY